MSESFLQTMTGVITTTDGNGRSEKVRFVLTLEDTCCEGHAESNLRSLMNHYVQGQNDEYRNLGWRERVFVTFDADRI